ncbi:unnamed protein product [Linum trigynum]|uniref:Uncharacterized protein n=1 Tax=Linum trigynum TaxID=586398 RepID=A0AAV2FUD7_9ROSI
MMLTSLIADDAHYPRGSSSMALAARNAHRSRHPRFLSPMAPINLAATVLIGLTVLALIVDDTHLCRRPWCSPVTALTAHGSHGFSAHGSHRSHRLGTLHPLRTMLTTLGAHGSHAFTHSGLLPYFAPLLGHDLPHGVSA